jgi:hypothetical protein
VCVREDDFGFEYGGDEKAYLDMVIEPDRMEIGNIW